MTFDKRPVVNGGYGPGWDVAGSNACGEDSKNEMKGRINCGVRFELRRIVR